MRLCSEYIIKIDEFRKLVNRKLKSGQYDDLHKLTSNKKLIDKEVSPELLDDTMALVLKKLPEG